MSETINDHHGFVMWMIDARGVDDEVRLWWKADMMCSAGQGGWPLRWELWLLFDDAAFSFSFSNLACTAGCDLAGLHEFANVPEAC
jgi:hypothetical protein